MRDFSFFNPTRIEFGKGKENNIGQYLSEFACKKVLIIYGSERVKTNGLFDRVVSSLKNSNIEFVAVGGVISNPLLSKVHEAIAVAREHAVDSILAVGGGSVLDSAKTVAAGVKYDGDVWDFYEGKASIEDALPVFSIMTLAATGSEMNQFAVVTNEKTQEKPVIFAPCLFPKVSVINPELMATVSDSYLAYSAVDVFAHCLDLYFSAAYMPDFNKRFVENIMKTVVETTDTLLKNRDDYEARGDFAWASSMALCGLSFSGVEGNSYDTHLIEHAMSALYNVPHGAGLAVVLPAWMRWHNTKNQAQYKRFATEVFNVLGAEEGINAMEAWFRKIGAPVTLKELDIPKDAIPALAEHASKFAAKLGWGDLYPKEVVTEILDLA